MTASAPVPVICAVTGVRDADGDLFEVGAFRGSSRSPRVTAVPGDWSTPIGRADLVELRPGDPRLPARTPEGRRWPRAAGALVGRAVLNLAVKGGEQAYRAAARGRAPCSFGLGFRATGSRHDDGGRTITAAEVYTISPAGLATKGRDVHMETKAAPGSRPWDRDEDEPRSRPPRPLEPGKLGADEVDEFHDVDDDLSLALSPEGMTTLRCSLCARDFGWADAGPGFAVCEDCAKQSARARARRGADGAGDTAGGDRESAASARVRATFPRQPRPGSPGSDAAGDPRYSQRPDGTLDREDDSRGSRSSSHRTPPVARRA